MVQAYNTQPEVDLLQSSIDKVEPIILVPGINASYIVADVSHEHIKAVLCELYENPLRFHRLFANGEVYGAELFRPYGGTREIIGRSTSKATLQDNVDCFFRRAKFMAKMRGVQYAFIEYMGIDSRSTPMEVRGLVQLMMMDPNHGADKDHQDQF